MDKKIIKKIQHFAELFENIRSKKEAEREEAEKRLFGKVNELNSDELERFSEYYKKPEISDKIVKFHKRTLNKKDKGGVKVLRYNLLQRLHKNEKLTSEIIKIEKQKIKEVVNEHDKNYDPFCRWSNVGILYPFCYYSSNKEIKTFLEKFTDDIITKLGIGRKTDKKTVTFNGSQNQGYDHCWIAIYDSNFKSQRDTNQLYVGFFKDEIVFDIYEHATKKFGTNLKTARRKIPYEEFSESGLIRIVEFFKDKKEEIFKLRNLKKELDETKKEFNKRFRGKKRNNINKKIYSEQSTINSQAQVIKRTNYHHKIYNSTKEFFENNFSKCSYEDSNVDITATKDDKLYLFEIKPFDDPKYTIRSALGQLIEYYYEGNKKADYLCFIGINHLGENKSYFGYVKKLFINESFKLRYFYVDYKNRGLIEDE